MTESELKTYEAEADGVCSSCMTLIAEIRRLRGLIKDTFNDRSAADCQWCDGNPSQGPVAKRRHHVSCPAFTESGDVR